MTPDYRLYLAAHVLSEDKVVTYRLLSRVLKVHVNKAKEMLFEFYRQQNARKPGSIHAVYMVAGTWRTPMPVVVRDDNEFMHSSPPIQSSQARHMEEDTEEIPCLTISLVKEEELEILKNCYESITSIHIYSIGPHPLQNVQLLSDTAREVCGLDASQDPLSRSSMYGTIGNVGVKLRDARRPAAAVPLPARAIMPKAKAEVMTVASAQSRLDAKPAQPDTMNDFFSKDSSTRDASVQSEPKSVTNPATLKRDSSSIFKSFAKAKPKLKKEDTNATSVSEIDSAAPSAQEDEPMKDVSDDEDENDDYIIPPSASKNLVDSDRKSRKDREAALRMMMEDEDDFEEAMVPTSEESILKPIKAIAAAEEPTEQIAEVPDGRRRGRRRVTKKRTIKDEEGYLVTKEETTWESFSEEEPASIKTKLPAPSLSSGTGKGKKSATKGQGNIMSFFGKPKK